MSDGFKIGATQALSLQNRNSARIQAITDQLRNKNSAPEATEIPSKNGKLSSLQEQKMNEAATQFEALLVHQMIKSMWDTVPKDGMFSGGNEESMYQDMYQEALSDEIANGQGMGIKEVLLKEFMKQGK